MAFIIQRSGQPLVNSPLIYSLLSIIQYNWHCKDLPTYVAFIDYTTAYPSVHRDSLYHHLHSCGIRGHMWHQLRARLSKILVRVLHPNISRDTYTTGKSAAFMAGGQVQALGSFGDTASHLPDCCSLHALVLDAEGPYLNRPFSAEAPSRSRHFAQPN